MSERYVIKICGAAGQGIKTSGMVLSKALKKAGYAIFGYTEYPSLIRGGHNVFQIDISNTKFASISNKLNILLALDQNSIKLHAKEIAPNGVMIFDENVCTINEELQAELEKNKIEILPLKLLDLAQQSGGTGIMKNTVSLGALWAVLELDMDLLNAVITQNFNKSDAILALNLKCALAGYQSINMQQSHFEFDPDPSQNFSEDIIINGNDAIGLGAIAGGVRLYASYPMTPASSILSFLATHGTKKGMLVKQAEDELTAANMVVGAYYAGTRAMCGTSGGGFDLMTETLSLAGITETPFVVILGQRPGPATGVPTWTAQGDLNLALYAGHGEFPRIVLAAGDPEECFLLTAQAHNLAEKYQTPVILLTDKFLAESYFATPSFDQNKITIERGNLLISPEVDAEDKTKMRYELTESGISDRWLPGSALNTYISNSDEHTPKGYSTEEGPEIKQMLDKRMRKLTLIQNNSPLSTIYGAESAQSETLILSWGSNKQTIIDVQNELLANGFKTTFLHTTQIFPLNVTQFKQMMSQYKRIICVEVNQTGQFANLVEAQTGEKITDRILKYDGRPFYFEELYNLILGLIQ